MESGQTQLTKSVRKIVSKKPRKSLKDRPPFQTGAEEVNAAPAQEAAPALPAEEPAPTKRRVVKKKKRVPIKDRPEWKDVDLEEFNVGQQQEVAETPIDIFGRTAPSDAGPSARAPSPRARPRQPEPPQPAGSRARAPRDTWGGFK